MRLYTRVHNTYVCISHLTLLYIYVYVRTTTTTRMGKNKCISMFLRHEGHYQFDFVEYIILASVRNRYITRTHHRLRVHIVVIHNTHTISVHRISRQCFYEYSIPCGLVRMRALSFHHKGSDSKTTERIF